MKGISALLEETAEGSSLLPPVRALGEDGQLRTRKGVLTTQQGLIWELPPSGTTTNKRVLFEALAVWGFATAVQTD